MVGAAAGGVERSCHLEAKTESHGKNFKVDDVGVFLSMKHL